MQVGERGGLLPHALSEAFDNLELKADAFRRLLLVGALWVHGNLGLLFAIGFPFN
jgi:hypothetical protein